MGAGLDLSLLQSISPQEGSLWEFYFIDVPQSLRGAKTNTLQKAMATADALATTASLVYYKYLVKEVTLPIMRNFDTAYDEATKRHYYNNISAYSDLSVTFMETEKFSVSDFLYNFQKRFYSNYTSSFISNDPTIMGILIFYGKYNPIDFTMNGKFDNQTTQYLNQLQEDIAVSTKATRPTKIFLLNGLKLKTCSDLSVSYSNTDPLSISATFAVEDVTPIALDSLIDSLTPINTSSVSAFI